MNFITVQRNVRTRLTENLNFLNYISAMEPTDPQKSIPIEVNIMKGLFYVHLYSSLEKTFNELVENAIVLINSKSVLTKHYNPSFLLVALSNQLKSFKMCNSKNYINNAHSIFLQSQESTALPINETTFSDSLQNVWFKSIQEVCQCFGIKLTTSARTKTTINELVDKRNAVAHGRENAAEVGSRFRTDLMRIKYNEISDFCYELINLFEACISNKAFLKPASRRLYS